MSCGIHSLKDLRTFYMDEMQLIWHVEVISVYKQ